MKTATGTRKRTREYVVNEAGRRTAVVVPIREYQALLQAAEDLADLRALDEALAEGGTPVPLERAEARLRAKGKLR